MKSGSMSAQSSDNPPAMLGLPQDVHLEYMQYLSPWHLGKLSQVCKTLQTITTADDLWERLIYKNEHFYCPLASVDQAQKLALFKQQQEEIKFFIEQRSKIEKHLGDVKSPLEALIKTIDVKEESSKLIFSREKLLNDLNELIIRKAINVKETSLTIELSISRFPARVIDAPDLEDFWKKIYKLILANNKLFALPDNIGKLRSLHELDLSENRLTSIPKTINQLNNLMFLDIAHNNISELRDDMITPENEGYNVEWGFLLNVTDNCLEKIPDTLKKYIYCELPDDEQTNSVSVYQIRPTRVDVTTALTFQRPKGHLEPSKSYNNTEHYYGTDSYNACFSFIYFFGEYPGSDCYNSLIAKYKNYFFSTMKTAETSDNKLSRG